MTADLLDDRDIALQIHQVLSEIDPVRWRDEMAAALKPKLRALQLKLEQRAQHTALAETLKAELGSLHTRNHWLALRKRLQAAYMELAKSLQAASIYVPSIRPTNYARNLLHLTTAVVALVVLEFLASPARVLGVAVAWGIAAWTAELSRRFSPRVNALMMTLFAPVAHPHEAQRVNSATWYATALVLLALTQSTLLGVAGVVVLGVGDPIAALVGRRFGRIMLLHGRSLEGTLAFVVSATAATFLVFAVFHPALGPLLALGLAASAAVAGALAELVSLRVDDNFSIPLSAAAGVVLISALANVPLS